MEQDLGQSRSAEVLPSCTSRWWSAWLIDIDVAWLCVLAGPNHIRIRASANSSDPPAIPSPKE